MDRFVIWCIRAALLFAALCGGAGAAGEIRDAGGKAPPFALRDVDGREHHLADYRGKVVLLNFWATWCEPCREEMPSLDRLAEKLAGRPFAVLAVDYGEGPPKVRAFAEAQRLRFPLLLDRDGAVARSWKVRVLPASYVIGPDQQLRHVVVGARDWDSADTLAIIEKLLPKR